MEFTYEQEEKINQFHTIVQALVITHSSNHERASIAVDDPAFYGPLCEMIAEFAANHGVDIEYPVHVTRHSMGGKIHEDIQDHAEPTDHGEREWWDKYIDDKLIEKEDQ